MSETDTIDTSYQVIVVDDEDNRPNLTYAESYSELNVYDRQDMSYQSMNSFKRSCTPLQCQSHDVTDSVTTSSRDQSGISMRQPRRALRPWNHRRTNETNNSKQSKWSKSTWSTISTLLSILSTVSIMYCMLTVSYYSLVLLTLTFSFFMLPSLYFIHHLYQEGYFPTWNRSILSWNMIWLRTSPIQVTSPVTTPRTKQKQIHATDHPNHIKTSKSKQQTVDIPDTIVDVRVFADDNSFDVSDHSSEDSLHIPGLEDRLNHQDQDEIPSNETHERLHSLFKRDELLRDKSHKKKPHPRDYLCPYVNGSPIASQIIRHLPYPLAIIAAINIWSLLIPFQAVYGILYGLVYASIVLVNIPFQFCWGVIGYLLFYTSLWKNDDLWCLWLYIWTGDGTVYESLMIDEFSSSRTVSSEKKDSKSKFNSSKRRNMSLAIRLTVSNVPIFLVEVVNISLYISMHSVYTIPKEFYASIGITLTNIIAQPIMNGWVSFNNKPEENANRIPAANTNETSVGVASLSLPIAKIYKPSPKVSR